MFMKNNPIIDILVPTFNRGFLLTNCINNLLKQNYVNFNIIVSDNNSTDNTEEIVSKFVNKFDNIFYYKNSDNYGIYGNYNYALANYCKGDYTIIVSDDDFILDTNYLLNAIEQIVSRDLIWISAGYYIADTTTMKIKCNQRSKDFFGTGLEFMKLHKWGYDNFAWFSVIFNRKKMLALDGFDNALYNSDFDQLFKLSMDSNCGILSSPVGIYTLNVFQENHLIEENFMFNGYQLYLNLYALYPIIYNKNVMTNNIKAYLRACFRYFLDRDAFGELIFQDEYWLDYCKHLSNGLYYPFFDSELSKNYQLFQKDKVLFAKKRTDKFTSSWLEITDSNILTLLTTFTDYTKKNKQC